MLVLACLVLGMVTPDDDPDVSELATSPTTQEPFEYAPAPEKTSESTVESPASPTQSPTRKPSPRPKRTSAKLVPKPVNLCGAPRNPYGYTFCGGSLIYNPKPDTCSYFACIDNFWNGKGYMMQCDDGMYTMSGGRSGSCSHHDGNRRPVYQ